MKVDVGREFLWGAATAAFQIEGALIDDGRGPSIWDGFARASSDYPFLDPATTADHYHRMDEDLDLLAELGLRAYRFSISWPRIMPDGRRVVNQRGLDFYRRLVDGLRRRGITPVATISHFDLPQRLEESGGWAARATAGALEELAAVLADALGDSVGHWITINEPWAAGWLGYGAGVLAPGRKNTDDAIMAVHHQLLGHGLAMAAIRSIVPDAQVGATLGLSPVRTPGTHAGDLAAAALVDASLNRMSLDPLLLGQYPAEVLERYCAHERGLSAIRPEDLDVISARMDFLGVNYYYPRMVIATNRANPLPDELRPVRTAETECFEREFGAVEVAPVDALSTSQGWPVDSSGLAEILMRLTTDYPPVPVIITENGAAFEDAADDRGFVNDADRIGYLAAHIAAAVEAMLHGADVRGYFVWSLLDNFEWNYGLTQRYGLVRVDRGTQQRVAKASAHWFRQLVSGGTLDRGDLQRAADLGVAALGHR